MAVRQLQRLQYVVLTVSWRAIDRQLQHGLISFMHRGSISMVVHSMRGCTVLHRSQSTKVRYAS